VFKRKPSRRFPWKSATRAAGSDSQLSATGAAIIVAIVAAIGPTTSAIQGWRESTRQEEREFLSRLSPPAPKVEEQLAVVERIAMALPPERTGGAILDFLATDFRNPMLQSWAREQKLRLADRSSDADAVARERCLADCNSRNKFGFGCEEACK
jgi:hypothetical protein